MSKSIHSQLDTQSYWVSYSDLMAGLLIVFILISIFTLLGFKDKEEKLQEKTISLEEKTIEVKQKEKELDETKKEINDLLKIKARIINYLQEELHKNNIRVDIDKETGAIVIEDTLLFDTGQYNIKPEGRAFLKNFFPLYVKILLHRKDIRDHISEIIIEGHTDDVGTEIYNLELSQQRAYAVSSFLMKDEFKYPYKDILINKLTAVGKGKSYLIKEEKVVNNKKVMKVNRDKSRRVEFKFRLNEEELLIKIKDMIENSSDILSE